MNEQARIFLYLVAYSARRQLRSKKTLLAAGFIGLVAIAVRVAGYWHPWDAKSFGDAIVHAVHMLFLLPMVALMFGTGALGDDREEKTLVYLLTRPLHRRLIYAGKLFAVIPHVLLFSVGGLAALWAAARSHDVPELDGQLELYLPGVALSALAYVSFFHLLSAFFRNATLFSIVYVFLVEVVVGNLPGVIKRVSISFYTWSVLYEDAAGSGVKPGDFYFPVSAGLARWLLAGFAIAFLAIGAEVFRRKEYHDSGG